MEKDKLHKHLWWLYVKYFGPEDNEHQLAAWLDLYDWGIGVSIEYLETNNVRITINYFCFHLLISFLKKHHE